MYIFLVIVLVFVFIPLANNSYAETGNFTEQVPKTNNTSSDFAQEILDSRVKVVDFDGKPTSAIVNEKTNIGSSK